LNDLIFLAPAGALKTLPAALSIVEFFGRVSCAMI
jgi:hypothetical protein